MRKKPLPIGKEDFESMIKGGGYYVDKTLLIKDIVDSEVSVNLFTRPRRFGKTLNLSMLKNFFEAPVEGVFGLHDKRHLFNNLNIEAAGERYMAHQGRYPVIFIKFNSAKQGTFKEAQGRMREEIRDEFARHSYLAESCRLGTAEKEAFRAIYENFAPEDAYLTCLKLLSQCLEKHHAQKCIILIDEYDVPLENAYFEGFYDGMVKFIRSLFESALKTNDALAFGVITGCLRISKESIFTGLNNLRVNSILAKQYAEYFGFTEHEVMQALEYYEIEHKQDEARGWYNGYIFGDITIYNPWSVVQYLADMSRNPNGFPNPYWSNTSANSIVRTLAEKADAAAREEVEILIGGGSIIKPVYEDIVYSDIDKDMDHLWNFLFFTGYLKKTGETRKSRITYLTLTIPNEEILYIYERQMRDWFFERIKAKDFTAFYQALTSRDTDQIEQEIRAFLMSTISYMDYRESFYHGALTGLLAGMQDHLVKSNREAGEGRSDLIIRHFKTKEQAMIIEIKTANSYKELEARCNEALAQIEEKKYADGLKEEGYAQIIKYGIAFYKKDCKVKVCLKTTQK